MSELSNAPGAENVTSAKQPTGRNDGSWKRLRRSRARQIASISAVVLLMGCILTVARVPNRGRSKFPVSVEKPTEAATTKPPRDSESASNSAASRADSATGRLEVESIILTRFGFEPDNITRSQAEFMLSVENRSPADDIELHLDNVAGSRLHQQQVAKERPDWRNFLILPPGDYVLTEAKHPDWQCKIKITPL